MPRIHVAHHVVVLHSNPIVAYLAQKLPDFYRIRLVGEISGKETIERPRRRWNNNTKIDLKATEWEGMYSIFLPQDRDRR
jgi:hypothetical protein